MSGDVRLDELLDVSRLETCVEQGLVRRRPHPSAPLVIYDYTPRATYSRTWTEETRLCRGLIVDAAGVVRARPFPKFFALGDPCLGPLPDVAPIEVTEKVDGSLGILYSFDGRPAVATRGAFASAPAQWATAQYRDRFRELAPPPGVTWLFEIVYPANRVVVDYGDFAGLVLLAAIDIATGADVAPPSAWPGPVVTRRADLSSLHEAQAVAAAGPGEGLVARFSAGPGRPSVRVKLKSDEYLRLHRLLTGVSPRDIWERLSSGKGVEDLVERVPAEFAAWVRATADRLEADFAEAEASCRAALAGAPGDRRAAAAWIEQRCALPAVALKMLDGRRYDQLIWRAVQPPGEPPFRADLAP